MQISLYRGSHFEYMVYSAPARGLDRSRSFDHQTSALAEVTKRCRSTHGYFRPTYIPILEAFTNLLFLSAITWTNHVSEPLQDPGLGAFLPRFHMTKVTRTRGERESRFILVSEEVPE